MFTQELSLIGKLCLLLRMKELEALDPENYPDVLFP